MIFMLIIKHSWQHKLPLSGDFGNSTRELKCAPGPKFPLYKPSSVQKWIIIVLSYSRNQWYRQKRNNNLPFGNFCWKIMTYSGDFGNSTFARRVPKSPIFTSERVKSVICMIDFWLRNYKVTHPSIVTSTNGLATVVAPKTHGKKPGQRKRKVNERTTTVTKRKKCK